MAECKGCSATVRLAPGEVERILAAYLRNHQEPLASDAVYNARLTDCSTCKDLQYGTTCRHCGCLVAVRARLLNQHCPAVPAAW